MTLPPGTPDLEVLDLLVSVAELGSLGAAARRHGISQPAASMRISALERRLHLRLLDRGPTGSALTDAGRAVVDRARDVLEAARSFGDAVAELRARAVPRLRVAASKTIADHRIPQWLQTLRDTHPEVSVALEVANSRQVMDMVRGGGADLGFVEGPHPPPDLGSRVLGADELVVVVAPAHAWATRRDPLTVDELAATPLLWREPGSGTRDAVWEALAERAEPARPAAELGSAATIVAAARTALAPAVLSRLIAAPDLASGALVEVPLAGGPVLTRQFRAVWRRGAPPSGPARALADIAAGDLPAQ
ncbi:LysR family transcriptional regulator [Nocardia puris]|uniref:LysR substrate-binding domain-containing protein n=1 Tax=Nocardia puris TaxID=208602 RepID=UPI0018952FD8|nr:LysR substrate-binding domain-containing protein [Nocardia puris]MBF6212688.1 LysR family transcriptional regulator [Nocardia puris]MBF6367626.1 LysR family transcriptional regulator [Nocardia puris]MBF6461277.1 LysR family transcriptional regulator [Nocardia puris]